MRNEAILPAQIGNPAFQAIFSARLCLPRCCRTRSKAEFCLKPVDRQPMLPRHNSLVAPVFGSAMFTNGRSNVKRDRLLENQSEPIHLARITRHDALFPTLKNTFHVDGFLPCKNNHRDHSRLHHEPPIHTARIRSIHKN